jgi:predicted Rossmann fold flavoprotein
MIRATDIAVVGAGAAGLATAIFTRRLTASRRVMLVDGARRPGAKILVSGGGRCNVTNATVDAADFHGGSRAAIRQVLRSLPADRTVEFFRELGVPLHEEEHGKLFPDSNRARDVLDALLGEAERAGVERVDLCRIRDITPAADGFLLRSMVGDLHARRVVLATGGQSLPKSGSDGAGYDIARQLGHTIVPPVPALVPLLLDQASPLDHASVSGVSHPVELTVWVDDRAAARISGSMLWTHFGISGPAALDASRHWTRAMAEGRRVRLTMNVRPSSSFEAVDGELRAVAAARPRATLQTVVADWLPAAVAAALLHATGLELSAQVGQLTRDDRRRLAHALAGWPLPVVGTRGYNYAEVTAGGVPLNEVNPKTMESRVCPGLSLVGEVVDVDGRLGGFNFQWAWASAHTAARHLAVADCPISAQGSDPRV